MATHGEELQSAAVARHRLGGYSDTWLANQVKAGRMPKPTKINGRLFFPKRVIDHIVEHGMDSTPPAADPT